jgi:isopenicillin-N epimerase
MDLSTHFIKDDTFSHLNAGTRTRTPLRVLDFIERERRDSERNPTKAMFTGYDRIWDVQKRLGAFLGADPHDLFLRNNVTSAFNDFLFALPPLERGEVVATGWEYGGTVGLLQHWARLRGHPFRSAPLELHPGWDSAALARAVLGALRSDTRVLLVSHVATGTGTILPVKEITAAARAKGILVLIDGAHAVGALPLALGDLAPDFYGGNFHKWFLGPEGTGFGWVHPTWVDRLDWPFGGWASETPPSFYQGFGDKRAETCRRFFPGTIDRVPFLALGEVLSFWEEYGPDRLRARQAALRDLVIERALANGYTPRSPLARREILGPVVAFDRPAGWVGEHSALATRLYYEAKVQLALPDIQGVKLVRFSPGVHATEQEIRAAFESLAAWKP